MIFVAVTLGYAAENIREHFVETKKAVVSAKNLYKDVLDDSVSYEQTMHNRNRQDTLFELMNDLYEKKQITNHIPELYAAHSYISLRMLPIMNSLALADTMNKAGLTARVMSAIAIDQVVEPYVRPKALQYLEEGKVVIFAAGTGNPFFTTDTAAALRGAEIGAEMVLKATKVDGVYTADPKKDPAAKRYSQLSFDDAIGQNLGIMDATAFALCRDQKLPIKVFSIFKNGALRRVVLGEDEGTLVHV